MLTDDTANDITAAPVAAAQNITQISRCGNGTASEQLIGRAVQPITCHSRWLWLIVIESAPSRRRRNF